MPAFFRATVSNFLETQMSQGLDKLTEGLAQQGFDQRPDHRASWIDEWELLQTTLRELSEQQPGSLEWSLLLEYPIPGRQKRIDAVLLTTCGIIIIEFKSGDEVSSDARWQAKEYCWNLRDFHVESRGVPLAPILCVSGANCSGQDVALEFSDRLQLILDLQTCNAGGLTLALRRAFECLKSRYDWQFNLEIWDNSHFRPTPSIIEFAQQVFDGHDVPEISHATADNTDDTLERIRLAIIEARHERKRVICFVTGVPGAGKTLVGLNAAYRPEMVVAANGPICFASGNKPLLDVLETAVTRSRSRTSRHRREVAYDLTAPVQDVHDYVRSILSKEGSAPPPFQAVVFDEAQRVWDADKLVSGLNTRKQRRQLTQIEVDRILSHGQSEPELLLSLMERCLDWCVVIALIGGGQEIHDGEAGLGAWGDALSKRTRSWTVLASADALDGGISNAGQKLFMGAVAERLTVVRDQQLHLAVSKRCLHAEHYAEWVNHVVNGNEVAARELSKHLLEYPVLVTRDLSTARELIRKRADVKMRSGLLASSGAVRLRVDGIEVSQQFRSGIKYPDWFLRPTGDIRSSSQLEVAATEFECQGLELDWSCVCWGNDFVMLANNNTWQFSRLGSPGGIAPRWSAQPDPQIQEFIRNKYRVLLTRARVGIVIFMPRGSTSDATHLPSMFNPTADYLARCGAEIC